ncbi:MAG: cation transporter [Cytophagales bacterium]|nr:MAG: cation transporter [Cytophagales bacterium]
MKSVLKITLFFSILLVFSSMKSIKFPDEISATIKVSGVCGMCKKRIEEAVYVTGIKSATWDSKTQLLTVSYKPKKISEIKIHELVAGVGHDTEKVKAKDETYKNLPDCCLYRDGASMHKD